MAKRLDPHALTDAEIVILATVLRKAQECAFCSNGTVREHHAMEEFVAGADAIVRADKHRGGR